MTSSVTFTSTLVTSLTAFVYYDNTINTTAGVTQPFNNDPDNSLINQYTSVTTDDPATGLKVSFQDSYVSLQGSDADGNMYYWVSFLIDPTQTDAPSTALMQTVTEPGTVVNLDNKPYNLLYACDPNGTPCPNGLACYNDPMTKKNYCVGIKTSNFSIIVLVIIFIFIILCCIIFAFLCYKLFGIVNVNKV